MRQSVYATGKAMWLLRRGEYNACGTIRITMFAKRTHWDLTANRLSEALERHRAAGKPLIDLTVSNPTECGFVYQRAILDALGNPAALKYEPVARGLATARQCVAEYYIVEGARVCSE